VDAVGILNVHGRNRRHPFKIELVPFVAPTRALVDALASVGE